MKEYGQNDNSSEINGVPLESDDTVNDEAQNEAQFVQGESQNESQNEAQDESHGAAQDESVDEILAEIMGDGGDNDDFSGLFARYLGGGRAHETFAAENDTRRRVEYEAPPEGRDVSVAKKGGFEEKLPEGMRVVYDAVEEEARRPEFTSSGEVRYPSMGYGEEEERVVYDASWEEQAKKDAAKREARRRSAALMGDGAYARSFVSGGMPMANRSSTADRNNSANRRYIDPLDDDDTPPQPVRASAREISKLREREEEKVRNSEKSDKQNSFFQDGFSERSGNPAAADGKTYDASSREASYKAASEKSENTENTRNTTNTTNTTRSASSAENAVSSTAYAKTLIDDAVLDAFARSQKSDEDFRERWKSEIEIAEKRKKARAEAESKKKAQLRVENERREVERKALAGDRPGIPLEIDGAQEAPTGKKTARSPKAAGNGGASKTESSFFNFSPEGLFDVPAEAVVEKVSLSDIPARAVMSSPDRTFKKNFGERAAFFFKTRFSAENIRRKMKEILPQKGDSKAEITRKIVRILSFLALAIAIVYLIVYFIRYEARKRNDALIDKEMEQTLPQDELDDAWADIRARYPDVDFPEGMNIKFANTYAINSDVVGYLRIAGTKTNIGTILLQRKGDDTYYLYRDLYGKKSRYGNPYVKSSSSMARSGLSQNTIIYGHNTHDGLMFHELENYMTRDGYLDAPIITLDTLFEQTKWKVFAVMLTNSTPEADNNYVFTYLYSTFNSQQHYSSVLNGILTRSMIHTGVDVTTNDKILTLYTCYQSIFDGGRLVVLARQLREGESETVNAANVYYNSSARFPQAYYDARKMTNPYASVTEPTAEEQDSTQSTTAVSSQTTAAVESTTSGSKSNTSQSVTEAATRKSNSSTTATKAASSTEAKSEPKSEAKTEAKTEAATEAKTEAATEAKTEAKTEAATEAKPAAATEAKTEPKTEAATEAKTEPKTEAKTEPKTEAATEAKSASQSESKAA